MTLYFEHECAIIHRNRDRFGGLSNMHNDYPLRWKGVVWPSSESLYQALRFPGRDDLQKLVREQPHAIASKWETHPHRKHTRPDWEKVKVQCMESVLRLKYLCHPDRVGALLSLTGDMPIVEKSRNDAFWGAKPFGTGTLEGRNVLGLLWMLIREELKRDEFSSDIWLPLAE